MSDIIQGISLSPEGQPWLDFEQWKFMVAWVKEQEGKLNPFRIYRDAL
jgi:hypothetical protein